jgi:hypothetical protein
MANRRALLGAAMVCMLLVMAAAMPAQSILDLPRASQKAEVKQRIGLTDVTVTYSRPVVKGRKVWGGLVPYGKVWRAGADENTTIEFTDPVTVEGKPLDKGVYGLHMIPGETEWTVIFSRNATSWGSFSYKQDEDALRVPVKPQAAEFHEALTYDFDNVGANSAVVTLRWDKLAVPFKVEVNVNDLAQASFKKQLRSGAQYTWISWDEAASYLLQNKIALEDALKYANNSIQYEERFDNLMTKSNILEALNRKEEASKAKEKALAMASVIQLHSYGRQLQFQGQQDQAFEIFRINMKKNPDHWIVHSEVARLAVAKGDFDQAQREIAIAISGAPEQFKPAFENLARRVQAKEDINKN